MSISIQNKLERRQYTATSGQTAFPIDFPFFDNTYLRVYQRAEADEPSLLPPQLLTYITDWTATGAGQESGGVVTLNVGATVGDIITVEGAQPIDRLSVFDDLNSFAVSMNSQLNQITVMLMQNYTTLTSLTPKYRVDELINYDPNGNPIYNVREQNLELPILNDGQVWWGVGNLGDTPDNIQALDLATYIQTFITGDVLNPFSFKLAAELGTTANLGATYDNGVAGVGATLTNSGAMAALVIDSVAVVAGDRILVKNQTSQAQNGIYTVTNIGSGAANWVLTRAEDFDKNTEINGGEFVLIDSGATQSNQAWVQTENVTTVGTTNVIWVQFGASSYAPIDATYITQTPNGTLGSEQAMSTLATGLVKNTTGTGVQSIAVEGTDYYGPGGTDVAVTDGGTGGSSHTAYAVLTGGTTATGPIQSVASVGASGQVLTSNGAGALPSFQTNSATGSWVKIATGTASTSLTVDFDNVFDGTYTDYYVAYSDVTMSNDSPIRIRFGTGATPTYQATSYYYLGFGLSAGSNQTALSLCNPIDAAAATAAGGSFWVRQSQLAERTIITDGGCTYIDPTTTFNYTAAGGEWRNTTVVTSIQIGIFDSGYTLTTGEFAIYGLDNS